MIEREEMEFLLRYYNVAQGLLGCEEYWPKIRSNSNGDIYFSEHEQEIIYLEICKYVTGVTLGDCRDSTREQLLCLMEKAKEVIQKQGMSWDEYANRHMEFVDIRSGTAVPKTWRQLMELDADSNNGPSTNQSTLPVCDLAASSDATVKAGPQEVAAVHSECDSQQWIFDLDRLQIRINESVWDVRSESTLRWIRVLHKLNGAWIVGSQLRLHDSQLDGVKIDRLRTYLPADIAKCVETSRKHGSRLKITEFRHFGD